MSDEQILKQIMESKATQKLRESINEGQEFKVTSEEDKKALDNYNQMTETEKQQFTQKGWKNE